MLRDQPNRASDRDPSRIGFQETSADEGFDVRSNLAVRFCEHPAWRFCLNRKGLIDSHASTELVPVPNQGLTRALEWKQSVLTRSLSQRRYQDRRKMNAAMCLVSAVASRIRL